MSPRQYLLRRRRFLLTFLAGLLATALVSVVLVLARGEAAISRVYRVPEGGLSLSPGTTAVGVDRGRHVASAVALCRFCHGRDFSGELVIDDPWIGRVYTANLTKGEGGVGATFEDADWVRAIRFGVRANGRSLLFMPSQHVSALSDSDLASVIAYLRQVPSIATDQRATQAGWLMRLLVGLDVAPNLLSAPAVNRSHAPIEAIPFGPTARYGAYLTDVGSCRFCHRDDLKGGLHPLARPDEPVPPDLTRAGSMQSWNREEFGIAMRQGRTPDGRRLDAQYMPWPEFAGLSDDEVAALWAYLRRPDSAGSIAARSSREPDVAR